jgi:DNA-binding response OmpR family regulator
MSHVMLVEDDRTMRSLLKTLLEIEGFDVIDPNIESEESVFAAILQNNPDIIILDVHLRRGNGLDIVKKLRSDGRTRKINVLMSSGMDLREKCLEAGADNFILKPYMPDDLLTILHKYRISS